MSSNFRNLSDKQSDVFEQIAIGNIAGHNFNTIKSLLRKQLIRRSYEYHPAEGVTFYRYEVPLPIHIEWCEWCVERTQGELDYE